MMKSSFESPSAVTVVVWNRLESEAPKKGGDVLGVLGVESRNWMPESGDDSASTRPWVPVRPPDRPGIRYAAPALLLNPGEPTRIRLGWPALM